MRRPQLLRITAALAVTYGTVSVAAAQTTQTTTSTPVAYSGCLRAGSDLSGDRTLTPGKSPAVPLTGFVLASAQPSSATAAPTGQSSTTTTPPSAPPTTTSVGTMYRIVGLGDEELKKLSNQQVEVRGVLESPDKTATTGTGGPPASSQPTTPNPATGTSGTTAAVGTSSGSSPGQASAIQTLRASSIRVLSSSCSGGGTQ